MAAVEERAMAGDDERADDRRSLVDRAESAVRRWLAPGRFREGDRLPPEHELAAMLGVSRGTLRESLRRLEETGEVVRRQGSGTFVGRTPAWPGQDPRPMRVESYSLRSLRGPLTTTEVRITMEPITPRAAEMLELRPPVVITRVQRVLSDTRAPAIVVHDVVHPSVELPASAELERRLRGGALMHDIVVASGHAIGRSRTEIGCLVIESHEIVARQLALPVATACVTLDETVFGTDGRPLMCTWDVLAPGRMEVAVVRSSGMSGPDPAHVRPS